MRGMTLTGCLLVSCWTGAFAAESDLVASAELVQPVEVTAVGDLSFGTVAVPRTDTCVYQVGADGITSASGGSECQFISGTPLKAEFEVSCTAFELVSFEVIYTNAAPAGTAFSAPANPMVVAPAGIGAALQTQACDSDGLTDVYAGGKLTVTPSAPSVFTGSVGTIRLEALYE